MVENERRISRRTAVRLAGGATLLGVTGSRTGDGTTSATQGRLYQEDGESESDVTVVASEGELEVAPDERTETWLYDEGYPGPELRVSEAETLRVTVENRLPEGTTIHWHGVPVPNPMDGVPNVTQDPVPPDGEFTYEFEATPAGTYVYHSHVGLQIDRALSGPLIVEESSPHVEYDREYTLMVDDYLPESPRLDSIEAPPDAGPGGRGPGGRGPGGPGGPGPGPGGPGGPGGDGPGRDGGMNQDDRMRGQRPPYAGLTVNGRLPSDPPVFDVEEGDRVRLRVINPSGTTTYRVGVGGHSMTVTHADGRPVEPVDVDAFDISMGERYDVILEADNPGDWAIVAAPVVGDEQPAEARLRYDGETGDGSPERPQFDGSRLEYGDLEALEPLDLGGSPDRTFDFTLSGGMMSEPGAWTIDGQVYPDADPLEIAEGEHVRVRMVNRSPAIHPMHLHGHFFQVGGAVKDTVIVPPHGGQLSFDFLADNPGDWLFHCHNIYHLERGMARVFEYVR